MSHSFSKSWKAPETKAKIQWEHAVKGKQYICPNSKIFPKTLKERQAQELDFQTSKLRFKQTLLQYKQEEKELRKAEEARKGKKCRLKAFGGKTFTSVRGNVLSEETMWCPQATCSNDSIDRSPQQQDSVEAAEWPSYAAYKFDGDDRVTNTKEQAGVNYGRHLPVPRTKGNETVNWQMLPFADFSPFDEVRCKPTEESIFFSQYTVPELEMSDAVGQEALGHDLMAALDPKGIYHSFLDF